MHLAIDLRFYTPQPYGLAFHIRHLFTHLIPELLKSEKFTLITLIFSSKNKDLDLSNDLPWWDAIKKNNKFKIFFSKAKYYSFAEQTTFLFELNKINPDLTYFFTPNYPILFSKPFIYQVLDLSIPKTKSLWNPKVQAFLLCFKVGIKNAKHILFLGNNTSQDSQKFSEFQFDDELGGNFKKNSVIYNGLNPIFEKQPSANIEKAELLNLKFDEKYSHKLEKIKQKLRINKPYFLFVSVWKKHKNIARLVKAFNLFQKENQDKFQLVLVGEKDKSNPELEILIQETEQYHKKNIITPGKIENDEDLVCLHDGALAFVGPSLSEGFGLWIVESASRATPIICSDIAIFKEIVSLDSTLFFNPTEIHSINNSLKKFLTLNPKQVQQLSLKAFEETRKFKWSTTAKNIIKVLEEE